DERVAPVEYDLVPGPGGATEPGRDEQRSLHGAKRRTAVGPHHQGWWVTGVAQDNAAVRGRDRSDDGSHDPVLYEGVEESIQRREHLRRRQAGHGIGTDGASHLSH